LGAFDTRTNADGPRGATLGVAGVPCARRVQLGDTMSLHSRPVPAPKTPEHVTPGPVTPETHPMPPTGARSSEREPQPDRRRTPDSRAELAAPDATPWPWYRGEPWLAAMLAAFLPMIAAIFAPDSAKYPLIGLSALAVVVGTAMLIRQGAFQPHSRPASRREAPREGTPAGTSPRGRPQAGDEPTGRLTEGTLA
jgi:hypothetical protein